MTVQKVPTALKGKLCDALLQFDAMGDENRRDLYFSELEIQVGQSLNVRRYTDAKHDVWALVNACLTRPGALHAFAQIVRSFHGSSTAMDEVERLITQIDRQPTLTASERKALIELVRDADPANVATACEILPYPTDPELDWSDASAVVTHVETICAEHSDALVVLIFSAALAQLGSADAAKELHHWADSLGTRLAVNEERLRGLRQQAVDALRAGRPDEGAGDAVGEPDVAVESLGESMRTVTVVSRTVPETVEPPRIWGGPMPLRNPHFTGREELLLRLRSELAQHAKASVLPQTLRGLGGVGKTQLAIEYAYQYSEHYNLVWWISAERPTDALAALADLGQRLGLPTDQDRQQIARMVIEALAASQYRWLLIYDNADKPEDIAPLVPPAGGHVIMTSRNAEWVARWHSIEVDVFEREESIDLLRKRAEEIPEEIADKLADKLGDLPLALEQAVNFQKATGMPVEEYLHLFDERVRDLLSEGKPVDYPAPVYASLTLAFDNLRNAAPAAAELLDLFAFLGPEPISAGLLHSGRQAELSELLGRTLRDSILMNRMIRELPRYGLARIDPKGQKIQVHRLVRAVLRSGLGTQRRARTQENVRNLLAAASPSQPDEPETWHIHAELGAHILPADLIHSANMAARLVAIDQARYLWVVGDYPASRDLAWTMVEAWSKPPAEGGLGRDHEQTILAMRHLANALRMLGDYAQTRRLDEEAYDLLLNNPTFGNDHEHTVHVAFGLGFDLNMAGDLAGALHSDQENLARAIRVYGADHHYTLQAKGNVAGDLRQLGRFQEAYGLSEGIVHDHKDMFGDADTRTLFNITDLASAQYGLGRYRDALETQTAIQRLVKQFFKPHQRVRLFADRNIAISLRKTGARLAALNWASDNHAAFEAHFGPEHEYTLAAAMSHANALRAVGRLADARATAETAVNGYRKTFGDRHRLTLVAQVNFGIILRLLGEQHAARDLERDTFNALTKALGEEHPYTLSAASNYAISLLASHQIDASRRLTAQTLDISRRVRGHEHPDTLACAVNAALDDLDTAEDATDRHAAQQRFDQVVDVLTRALGGTEHPDVVEAIRGVRVNCDIEPPPT